MCELLLVGWPEPRPFAALLPWVESLERYGLGGFGWGAAWREAGEVKSYRHPTALAHDPDGRVALEAVRSTHFLVHLRRPSNLSTVSLADTQPFLAGDAGFAFAHNGRLDRAEQQRGRYPGQLAGRADSEVGFRLLQELLGQGVPAALALARVHQTLAGTANFGYLPASGPPLVYAGSAMNTMWTFLNEGAVVAATALHSGDDAVFELCFPGAECRRQIAYGATIEVDRSEAIVPGLTARS